MDLSYNKLNKLPKEIGNLINLEYLYLNNNKLKELPIEIGNLIKLDALYLDHHLSINQYSYSDSVLNLKKKNLTIIPPDIFSRSNIKKLNVSYNHLTEITPIISRLSF